MSEGVKIHHLVIVSKEATRDVLELTGRHEKINWYFLFLFYNMRVTGKAEVT